MDNTKKVFHLIEGTNVVLIASGYRWVCAPCQHENLTASAYDFVECKKCMSMHTVDAVCHKLKEGVLAPGTWPGSLFVGKLARKRLPGNLEPSEVTDIALEMAAERSVGSVSLTATGYSWRCPECGSVNFRADAHFRSAVCDKCGSTFPTSEARHKGSGLDIGFRMFPGAKWKTEEVIMPEESDGEDEEPDDEPADIKDEEGASDYDGGTFF